MAFTFPLQPTEVQDTLRIASASFRLRGRFGGSETAGGEYLKARLGPDLWGGEVVVHRARHATARQALALLSVLDAPGASFLIFDPSYPGPADDPGGAKLGSSTVTLTGVATNGDVSLAGLPASYWLRRGDYFAFTYGSSPIRYALHYVAADKQSGSGGAITGMAVSPPIRPGWAAGAAIRLNRPLCKAVIVPGSLGEPTMEKLNTTGVSFRWQQTFR